MMSKCEKVKESKREEREAQEEKRAADREERQELITGAKAKKAAEITELASKHEVTHLSPVKYGT